MKIDSYACNHCRTIVVPLDGQGHLPDGWMDLHVNRKDVWVFGIHLCPACQRPGAVAAVVEDALRMGLARVRAMSAGVAAQEQDRIVGEVKAVLDMLGIKPLSPGPLATEGAT